jgi:hypothetical protein
VEVTPATIAAEVPDAYVFAGEADRDTAVKSLMNSCPLEPVDGIERIGELLRGWREKGVYVLANTMTLPGCEAVTIDFFNQHLPDAIDGLILPRALDKGQAARRTIEELQSLPANEPSTLPVTAAHIDDTPSHNADFRRELGDLPRARVATFCPGATMGAAENALDFGAETPLRAFQLADKFLAVALDNSPILYAP